MNSGDRVQVHVFDAPIPGEPGQRALMAMVSDFTTGQTGYMQASARNGFADTSMSDCSGHPVNFQPEYNTARLSNIVPWAALETNISTEYETGHFTPCTSLSDPETVAVPPPPHGVAMTTWKNCNGPYEASAANGQTGGLEVNGYPEFEGPVMNNNRCQQSKRG